MNRNTVIEIAYKTIKDIEGIVAITDALLEKFNEGGKPCENDD